MNTRRIFLMMGLALALLLAACSGLEINVETETPEPRPTEATATPPEPTPTAPAPTAEPEATEPPGVLPRPLYFISLDDGQVWRVEADGRTLTRITNERDEVTEFDVSADGAALVYVTENLLVRADADGGNRTVLVTGAALTGQDDDFVVRMIVNPRWSPDGEQIAFGMNGVNLIPAAGGEPVMIQQSDPIPVRREVARFYRPQLWSPDGRKLVVAVNFWQEGLIYAVKDLARGALVDIESACCDPSWSADGRSLFMYSSSPEGYNPPGLWRVNPATGAAEVVIQGRTDGDPLLRLVAFPHEAADGSLRFLLAEQLPNSDGVYLWPPMFQLAMLGRDGEPSAVSETAYSASWEGGWAPGGEGLVIRLVNAETPLEGQFMWVTAEGEAVPLPADGTSPRW
jgi:hypothetical protein